MIVNTCETGERGWSIHYLADHGLMLTFGDHIDAGLSSRIACLTDALAAEALPGLIDLIPSYTTLLLIINPETADREAITDTVDRLWSATRESGDTPRSSREVVIPVVYGGPDGPDLKDVAETTGITTDEVVARHAAASYQVGAIGFSPGFAFLIGLPPELTVPRRSTPRTRVPAGSVGIGGAQTGIYSLPTPGGWSLIGRTPLAMFDPERDPPSLLQTGDVVRFEQVAGPLATPRKKAVPFSSRRRDMRDAIEVLEAGLQTSVQDLGRPGYGRLGVSPGGAVDRDALIAGNRLVGNDDGAAGLEMTLTGPRLRFLRPGRIVVSGPEFGARVNDSRLLAGAVRVVSPGDELTFDPAAARGARAYLCIAGGIDVPEHMGSRSTDLTAGFGGFEGQALKVGDRLRVGTWRGTHRPVQRLSHRLRQPVIRVVRGPHADRFDESAFTTLFSQQFTISSQSNRLGVRLEGHALVPVGGADIISEGMVTGAIQVTGQGQPIIMLPSRATIGGYPKIGVVVAADLDLLGQLRPGHTVRFEEVSLPIPEE